MTLHIPTDPHLSIDDQILNNAISWRKNSIDRELLSCLLPNHPRAFLNTARPIFSNPKENDNSLILKAFEDERLLRLLLPMMVKSGSLASHTYPRHYFELAILGALKLIASMPHKNEAWRTARLARRASIASLPQATG